MQPGSVSRLETFFPAIRDYIRVCAIDADSSLKTTSAVVADLFGVRLSVEQIQQIYGGELDSERLLTNQADSLDESCQTDQAFEYGEKEYLDDQQALSSITTEQWSLLLSAVSQSSLLPSRLGGLGTGNVGGSDAVEALAEAVGREIFHSTKDRDRSFGETSELISKAFDVQLSESFVEEVVRSLPLPMELAEEILLACIGLRMTQPSDVLKYIDDQPRFCKYYRRIDEVDIDKCLETAIKKDIRRHEEEGKSPNEVEVAVRATFGAFVTEEVMECLMASRV